MFRRRVAALAVLAGLVQPPQQHVVLVIIDGARYSETLGDSAGLYSPRMHALAASGAVVDTFLNDSLTYTERAIPAIWSGTWTAPADTTIGGVATQYTRVPTLWEYFRKDRGADSTGALYELKNLTAPWLPSFHPQYGPAYWPWYDMHQWSDPYVWRDARLRLAAFHPALTVLYLADVDHDGHSGVWADYTHAIAVADSIVGALWDFVQADPVFRNSTTILVTNDHGRHLNGTGTGFAGHGDACWGCRRIELLAAGRGVRHTTSPVRRRIPDIVPTIGALLGYTSPFSTGQAMTEILQPILFLSRDSLQFGTSPIGVTRSDSVVVYNAGGTALTLQCIPGTGTTVDPPTAVVLPHDSLIVRVSLTLTHPGPFATSVGLSHNDGLGVASIPVTGIAGDSIVVQVPVTGGWNLVSLPADVANSSPAGVFPGALSGLFGFHPDSGYVHAEELLPGRAYWLKLPGTGAVPVAGTCRTGDTVVVTAGWNMVGAPSFPVAASDVVRIPGGMILSPFHRYRMGYAQADTLSPGAGYWVKSDMTGSLVLQASPP
jgi:hypothetical protein